MGQRVSGAHALYYLKIVELVWFVITTLFWMVMWRSSFGVHDIQSWLTASRVIWILIAVAGPLALWPFAQGRRGTPVESLARNAFMLAAVLLVVDLALEFSHVTSFNIPYQMMMLGRVALGIAVDVLLWLAVVRTLPVNPGLSNAYFAALGAAALLSLTNSFLRHGAIPGSMMEALSWLRIAASLVAQLFILVVLRRLTRDGALGSGDLVDANAAVSVAAEPRAGGRDIAIGLAFLVGGALITFVSYSMASSSSGGGRYFITTGAIAYGLVKLVRGLVAVSSSEPPRR
jgi:hypothetical protein